MILSIMYISRDALVPFDKYELDDLLAPYKRKVVKADGKLRENFN